MRFSDPLPIRTDDEVDPAQRPLLAAEVPPVVSQVLTIRLYGLGGTDAGRRPQTDGGAESGVTQVLYRCCTGVV